MFYFYFRVEICRLEIELGEDGEVISLPSNLHRVILERNMYSHFRVMLDTALEELAQRDERSEDEFMDCPVVSHLGKGYWMRLGGEYRNLSIRRWCPRRMVPRARWNKLGDPVTEQICGSLETLYPSFPGVEIGFGDLRLMSEALNCMEEQCPELAEWRTTGCCHEELEGDVARDCVYCSPYSI